MLCLIQGHDVSHAYLDFLLALVSVRDDATPAYLVDYGRTAWQDREWKSTVLIELQHQIEVGGRAGSLCTGWFHSFEYFLVIVLVWFIIKDLLHLEIFQQVAAHLYWHLNRAGEMVVCLIVFHPVIHWVLHIADPVDITQDFQAACLLWMVEFLELLVAVVVQKVHHIFINIYKGWFCPLQTLHVHKAIEIENAKADENPVSRRHLYLILSIARQTIRNMDPGSSRLISRFYYVESVSVVVHNFFALFVIFLSTLWPKYYWICPEVFAWLGWVGGLVPIHILQLQRFSWVPHHFDAISTELYFHDSIDSHAFLVSEFSWRKDQLGFYQLHVGPIPFLKLGFHRQAEVIEKLQDSSIPVGRELLKFDEVLHAQELKNHQENRIFKINWSQRPMRQKSIYRIKFVFETRFLVFLYKRCRRWTRKKVDLQPVIILYLCHFPILEGLLDGGLISQKQAVISSGILRPRALQLLLAQYLVTCMLFSTMAQRRLYSSSRLFWRLFAISDYNLLWHVQALWGRIHMAFAVDLDTLSFLYCQISICQILTVIDKWILIMMWVLLLAAFSRRIRAFDRHAHQNIMIIAISPFCWIYDFQTWCFVWSSGWVFPMLHFIFKIVKSVAIRFLFWRPHYSWRCRFWYFQTMAKLTCWPRVRIGHSLATRPWVLRIKFVRRLVRVFIFGSDAIIHYYFFNLFQFDLCFFTIMILGLTSLVSCAGFRPGSVGICLYFLVDGAFKTLKIRSNT